MKLAFPKTKLYWPDPPPYPIFEQFPKITRYQKKYNNNLADLDLCNKCASDP